jgi:hypothetical protein
LLPARNPPPIRCPIPHRIRSASRLPKSYNRSNMQPAFSTPFPEPLPAAMPQLSEKPRHGVRSWNPAPHPGHFLCNSRTAIGLQFGRSGNVSGTVVAPNNAPPIGTPKTSAQCSIYQDGSATGAALSKICQAFPNGPKSNQIRGCLQSLYNPGSGYVPIPVIVQTTPGSFVDVNGILPGTGAHLGCFANAAGIF